MNPELEALIKAYDAWLEAVRTEAVHRKVLFEAMVDETLERHPSLSREHLLIMAP